MDDIVILNAKTVNHETIELAISEGKISFVGNHYEGQAKKEVDAKGAFLSAGWIDSHVHCFQDLDLYYDYPDQIGVTKGVTTVIDAGSTGENTIKDFYKLAKEAETNVYALMNISKEGIIRQDELADLRKVNEILNLARIHEMKNFIVGLKVRMSKSVIGDNGITPLKMAKELQQRAELPLMIHIGSNPPELNDIFNELDAGDVVTHCFNGKSNGILGDDGKVKAFAKAAYERGVRFDIGHGTDSFNFAVAREAFNENIKCHTVSTDTYIRNRKNGPVYDLATTLTKLLHIGYPLEELIPMVTEVPAQTWGFKNKGKLEIGADGDISLFKLVNEEVHLVDSNGNVEVTNEAIIPVGCTVAGKYFTSFTEREGLKK